MPARWKEDQKLYHRSDTVRLRDFNYSDPAYVYFVTLCARHQKEPFKNEDLSNEIITALLHLKETKIFLYCYCLMPDHLHVAISPRNQNLSGILRDFKSYTTKISWRFGIIGKLWQRNFYDHIARHDENLLTICQYILENPVRKGLVEEVEGWPYSALVDPLPL
ncbi:MAG: transposase [Candidatus Tectomicrobia bacterium]|uniref:Transposase n=1 Tax=Tectimicrobiota bacterium TaxID=2528274 RepID=A0A933GNE6_UNCTE|nr:transposase [Candidatus Tectomicrobia bacterium]